MGRCEAVEQSGEAWNRFLRCEILFRGAHLAASGSIVGGKLRLLAVGLIGDLHVTAIFTMRGEVRRIISMRMARDVERQRYRKVFDCGEHPPAWC
jgi:hypothetical protein